jgi:hypothetical protein
MSDMTFVHLHSKEISFLVPLIWLWLLLSALFSSHPVVGCYIIWVVDSIIIYICDNFSILPGSVWTVFAYKTWGSQGICCEDHCFAGCACHSLVDVYWRFRGDGDEGGHTGNYWPDFVVWYLKIQQSSVQKLVFVTGFTHSCRHSRLQSLFHISVGTVLHV